MPTVLLTSFTDLLPEAPAAAAPQYLELNPFGTWTILAAWALLVAVNLWCFRRILGPGRRLRRGV